MNTRVLTLDPHRPDPDLLRQAADVLRSGGLVAFPTETVYGLGASALDEAAVKRIFLAKGRPSNNPIIVHVAEVEQAKSLAAVWPGKAQHLATRFWPGPLTLVLPKQDQVPDIVTGGGPNVGLRMPAHPIALGLLQAARLPLAAPSANRSTELSPTRAEHVLSSLNGRIDLILDSGPCQVGLESTVLDLSGEPPRLLRPGMISREQIEAEIGAIVHETPRHDGVLPSPGLMERHYAPRTPVELVGADWEDRLRQLSQAAALVLGGDSSHPGVVGMPDDPRLYAEQLYAVLHELDQRGLQRILVQMPPDDPPWLAIRDRLRRAAHVEE